MGNAGVPNGGFCLCNCDERQHVVAKDVPHHKSAFAASLEEVETPLDVVGASEECEETVNDGGSGLCGLEASITVMIIGARGLHGEDWMPGMGSSHFHCLCRSSGCEVYRTRPASDVIEPDPIWEEEFEVIHAAGAPLEFVVCCSNRGREDAVCGKVQLDSPLVFSEGFNGELPVREAWKESSAAFLWVRIRAAGNDYPPAPPGENRIILERSSVEKPWGIDLNCQGGGMLHVMRVLPGPAREHNRRTCPEEQLRRGDFVASANGISGNTELLQAEMRRVSRLDLRVLRRTWRPAELTFQIHRPSSRSKYGVDFVKPLENNGLVVACITKGLFQELNNAISDVALQLQIGDRIVSVDNMEETPAGLLYRLESAVGHLQIGAIRIAPPPIAKQ